jgi:hypothetical protein
MTDAELSALPKFTVDALSRAALAHGIHDLTISSIEPRTIHRASLRARGTRHDRPLTFAVRNFGRFGGWQAWSELGVNLPGLRFELRTELFTPDVVAALADAIEGRI